jgi:hypothetical protein
MMHYVVAECGGKPCIQGPDAVFGCCYVLSLAQCTGPVKQWLKFSQPELCIAKACDLGSVLNGDVTGTAS